MLVIDGLIVAALACTACGHPHGNSAASPGDGGWLRADGQADGTARPRDGVPERDEPVVPAAPPLDAPLRPDSAQVEHDDAMPDAFPRSDAAPQVDAGQGGECLDPCACLLATWPDPPLQIVADGTDIYSYSKSVRQGIHLLRTSKADGDVHELWQTFHTDHDLFLGEEGDYLYLAVTSYPPARASIARAPKVIGQAGNGIYDGTCVSALAVDLGFVYFSDVLGLYRAPVVGGPAELLLGGSIGGPILLDDDAIFFPRFPGGHPVLSKLPKVGGSPTTLLDGQAPELLGLDASAVYWGGQEGLYRLSKAGGEASLIVPTAVAPTSIAVDASRGLLFVAAGPDIWRTRPDGSAARLLLTRTDWVGRILVDPTHVFWTEGDRLYTRARTCDTESE